MNKVCPLSTIFREAIIHHTSIPFFPLSFHYIENYTGFKIQGKGKIRALCLKFCKLCSLQKKLVPISWVWIVFNGQSFLIEKQIGIVRKDFIFSGEICNECLNK